MKEYSREWFIDQKREAAVGCAKAALATPGVFPVGCEIHGAIQDYKAARARLQKAKRAWLAFIAPAGGWAPDPFAGQYPEERPDA